MSTHIQAIYNQQIQDENNNLIKRRIVNFTGTGVNAVDNPATGKTDVIISSTVNINQTIQLAANNAYLTTGGGSATGALTTALAQAPNQIVAVLGAGSTFANARWQFVIPSNFVSNGVLKITTLRSTTITTAIPLTLYIDGVASNISAVSVTPAAQNVFQTFTFNLTTAVVAGQNITVLVNNASNNLYIKEAHFNYLS